MKPGSRIYIAGPMSNMPDFNYPTFNAVAAMLRYQGFVVENPAENAEQADWLGYMRLALAQLVRCDAVVMLHGWEHSRGASIEHQLALDLGIPVHRLDDVVNAAPAATCFQVAQR